MKFKKPLSALVVSALLLGGASSALAASANLQLSLPTSEVPGGSHTQLTFTTNVPGFQPRYDMGRHVAHLVREAIALGELSPEHVEAAWRRLAALRGRLADPR